MKIGNIDFGKQPLFLAPMEDVTDYAFRLLCKRFGASMVYTEFISADALIRDIPATLRKMEIHGEERPVGIQIYGRDTESMVKAAMMAEKLHPDIIDLNFGCPVKKVAGKGGGAGLLRNIPLMLEITRAVVEAVDVPVTAKTRLGWDSQNIVIEELAEQLQDCGIQALTIHGRTRKQMYTGEADWNLISKVKNNPSIHIPIIGNGDIASPLDAKMAFDDYGVDAVMIGRATFGNPWIFKEIRDYLNSFADEDAGGAGSSRQQGTKAPASLTLDDKIDVLKELLTINVKHIDEARGIIHSRRHLASSPVFKGIPNFRQMRISMLRSSDYTELLGMIEDCREKLKRVACETKN